MFIVYLYSTLVGVEEVFIFKSKSYETETLIVSSGSFVRYCGLLGLIFVNITITLAIEFRNTTSQILE